MTQRKAPGAVGGAPRAVDQKPSEGFKGRVDQITRRSRTRPLTRLISELRGYVCRLINKQGDQASADA